LRIPCGAALPQIAYSAKTFLIIVGNRMKTLIVKNGFGRMIDLACAKPVAMAGKGVPWSW
jgi:hypothetical protein